MCYSRDAPAFSISTILPRLYQLLCNDRRGNRCVTGLAQRFDTSRVIGMQVCQHNQVYVCGGAMQETSEIIYRQPYIEYGTRINDYATFIVDKIGVCHREAVGDGMHLTDLLGKWRWLLPGLCSCIHGTSVTTFIVAQVKADRNPQDTISYHKIDPYASRCVILASPMVHSKRPLHDEYLAPRHFTLSSQAGVYTIRNNQTAAPRTTR